MTGLRDVRHEEWDEAVTRAREPVAAVFWAEWCVPSRTTLRALEALAGTPGGLRFVAVDVEGNRPLVARYSVKGLPTVVLLVEGRERARRVGLMTVEDLRRLLAEAPGGGFAGTP